jgi:hypothetical protein
LESCLTKNTMYKLYASTLRQLLWKYSLFILKVMESPYVNILCSSLFFNSSMTLGFTFHLLVKLEVVLKLRCPEMHALPYCAPHTAACDVLKVHTVYQGWQLNGQGFNTIRPALCSDICVSYFVYCRQRFCKHSWLLLNVRMNDSSSDISVRKWRAPFYVWKVNLCAIARGKVLKSAWLQWLHRSGSDKLVTFVTEFSV